MDTPSESNVDDLLVYEKDPARKIAYLTLNRPDKLNAPNAAMRVRYAERLHEANIDDDVKVLVIRGAGDHWGGGADLPEQAGMHNDGGATYDPLTEFGLAEGEVHYPPKGSFRNLMGITDLYSKARGGCRSLQEFKKISILEVKGYCYGWHFYQAGDADIVVSSDDALFGHPAFRYVGWGPRLWTWIETMGLRRFQEMLFTGRPFTAAEMKDCGFLNSVVTRENLESEVEKYASACTNTRPTDTVVVQKTFMEIYKQSRGEYMGSILTAFVEAMGPYMVHDSADLLDFNKGMLDQGLAKLVKENEARFPPDWRLHYRGRRADK